MSITSVSFAEFSRDAKRSARTNRPFRLNHVKVHPPTEGRPYWRLDYTVGGRRREPSGGTTVASAYKAWAKAAAEIERESRVATGEAELGDQSLATLIDLYQSRGGPKGRWKDKTKRDRKSDFRVLREIAVAQNLRCIDLNASHLRQFLKKACGTESRARTVKSVMRTFLHWGWRAGYFTAPQSGLVDAVDWDPLSATYTPAPTRRAQAVHELDSKGGEVPTHQQVHDLAIAIGKRYTHGEGLVHVAANTGLRLGELLALAADPESTLQGVGNWVEIEDFCIHVHWQVDPSNRGRRPTKTNHSRVVILPDVTLIKTGFNVRQFLQTRCKAALAEQAAGMNPHALLFPDQQGGTLRTDNFDSRYARPAYRELGWIMAAKIDAKGNVRSMSRFTMHSLRDRFATTALQEWRYTPEALQSQGGWGSVDTIYKHYLGNTDDTISSIRSIHGL